MAIAPRATVKVVYEGVDISQDISSDLLSFVYNDNEGGKSDDVSLKLKNNHGKWSGAWLPQEGDTIEATIIKQTDAGTQQFYCGKCTIDDLKFSGPPSTIEINAVSVPIDNSVRRQKKSRAWENVKLSEIAADVASNAQLDLLFLPEDSAGVDPTYERRDQREETDLAFLQRICTDEGYQLKVTDRQLVVFNPEAMQQQPEIATYTLGESAIMGWNLNQQAHDVYKTVTVEYKDAATNKLNSYTYTDPDITRGNSFKVVQRVESIGEAERLAKSTAFNKNRLKIEGSLVVFGNPNIATGATIMLNGFGKFSGKYYIKNSKQNVEGGYTTAIEVTTVQEG